jgi:hypothetical protein
MSEERLNQSLYDAFIDAYHKDHPELTREQAAQAVTKLAQDGD